MKMIGFVLVVIVVALLSIAGCTKLRDELPAPTSGTLKVHEAGWSDSSSTRFHGRLLKEKDWDLNGCQPCHGSTFRGGTSGVSCYTCHSPYPHPDLWDTTFTGFRTSENFHGTFLRLNGWHLSECQACHGTTYGGGRVDFTCLSSGCHVDASGSPKSPDACNTCHGVFRGRASDTLSWAPPRAVNGDTVEISAGVGAHQAHLRHGEISNTIECKQCHRIPNFVSAPGHLSALPSEVVRFDTSLAALKTADHTFDPNPVFDPNVVKCSNVFCHGNWRLRKATSPNDFVFVDSVITGANFSPVWTDTIGASMACGTCHGLPPTGHEQHAITECGDCHTGVVDNTGKIADKSKHINGKVNVFDTERSF